VDCRINSQNSVFCYHRALNIMRKTGYCIILYDFMGYSDVVTEDTGITTVFKTKREAIEWAKSFTELLYMSQDTNDGILPEHTFRVRNMKDIEDNR
jgi:hypothetical protein